MHLGGKYKMSWSNDDLERFLQIWALCSPMNLSCLRGPWQIALSRTAPLTSLPGNISLLVENDPTAPPLLAEIWVKV